MSDNSFRETPETENNKLLSRRKALARLGLAAGVTAYVAPLVIGLNQAAADNGHGGGGGDNCPPGQHRSMGTCV